MSISLRVLLIAALPATCPLYAGPVRSTGWQEIRDRQPPALHLNLVLTKGRFFQGEKIEATLEFSNRDEDKPYALPVGAGHPGAVFHAIDENGEELADPLQWRNDWYPTVITGPVGIHPLGRFILTLPVNDSVRFDKPGKYTLYAQSRVMEGSSFSERGGEAELVTDKTTIIILPLTADEEKAAIDAAMRKIGGSESGISSALREGVAELNFLQTSAARDALTLLLARPGLTPLVRAGFLTAPDHLVEAERIMQAVRAGKVVLDVNGAELYGELKSSSLILGPSPRQMSEEEAQQLSRELWKARSEAQQEVLAAAVQASGDQGPAHLQALWSAFQEVAIHKNPGENDRDGGKARAALAAHQLELPETHVRELLSAWDSWGSPDFLPLIRREAGPPANSLVALIALAGLRPDEARPGIIEELGLTDSRFFQGSYPASMLLCKIPPMPLPRFNALFREKLAGAKGSAFPIIPLIGCFGSPALLPDVEGAYRKYGREPRTGWDDAVLHGLFLYWLRCDPEAGAAELRAEIQSRGKSGWSFLLTILRDPWTDAGLPVTEWALQSSDPNLAGAGIFLLELHGPESLIDPVIAALERFHESAEDRKFSSSQAARLLKSERWDYSPGQKRRLEALASTLNVPSDAS